MKQVFNVGIVGLGVVGQRLISQFKKNENIKIRAVCDTNQDLLKITALECEDADQFTNYNELLELEDIDFVYVAVPPAYHHQVVLAAAKHNKHILCEKPLANSLEEAEDMLKIVEEKKLVHAIHFPLVYEKGFATIKNMIENGYFGEIKRVTLKMHFHQWPRPWQQTNWISSRKQGGFIREISPHYLQLITYFFGTVIKVTSHVDYPIDPELCETGLIATIELENGIKVLMDGISGQAEKEEIAFTIHGEKSSLSLINWRKIYIAQLGGEWNELMENEMMPETSNLVSEFVKKMQMQDAHLVDFNDGFNIQKTLEKLLK
ncbi:Gfo/Idh/MocA family protein [Sutcliffiella rhizosphaerae]|uniref:Inositol 2-dehydrogenase/D-chiro-inositol 3-dehydrogenase n=1 Tax=Sutcliffiella rhizosphaerae TaxID=2880967 RepID=A0ABM8YP12_9BACI|nr:Gfo/Idh/MocA family oxidoreductase [Sutcliffiella rhizosphaerae]CAG9621651.1 Inositol 2-dehydrogenase/D-chiro-inositol 3-dehydrogenase [Sutcliffiella rhizosphaerae]